MFVSIPTFTFLVLSSFGLSAKAQNKPRFPIGNLPDTWEQGQSGSNQCAKWKPYNDKAKCDNVFINNVRDFCLWGPPSGQEEIGNVETEVVSYCLKQGYGTRLIPKGTITGAHFIKTPNFVQITGFGDFTKIHVKANDQGGELDPHGANGYGNPPGGLVFSRNVKGREGQWVQSKEWSSFMSATEFSLRACFGPGATKYCPHTMDIMGAQFNHPGNYDIGYFDECDADSGEWPAWYNGKEWHQGDSYTPAAHPAGKRYNCKQYNKLSEGNSAKVIPYRRSIYDDDGFVAPY